MSRVPAILTGNSMVMTREGCGLLEGFLGNRRESRDEGLELRVQSHVPVNAAEQEFNGIAVSNHGGTETRSSCLQVARGDRSNDIKTRLERISFQ